MELARITNPDDYLPFIEGAKDLDDLTIKVQKIIEQWGFSSFSYWLKQSPNGTHEPIAFATYPAEYSKHYMKNKYYLHDMIGLASTASCLPFDWSQIEDNYHITRMQKQLFVFARTCWYAVPMSQSSLAFQQ